MIDLHMHSLYSDGGEFTPLALLEKCVPEKIADWQEAYMDRLNKEYIELLCEDANPSAEFLIFVLTLSQRNGLR